MICIIYVCRLADDAYQTAKVAKVLLLLNSGKGAELKGKNLEEIEVSEDVVDFEELDEKIVMNDASSIHSNGRKLIENEKISIKLINKRTRWSGSDKKLVLKFFSSHVENRTAPKKHECLSFIKRYSNTFKETDWVRIKTLVYNTYRPV